MFETLLEQPLLIEAVCVIAGIIIKSFAPKWVPILGKGQKLIHELLQMHYYNPQPNPEILEKSKNQNFKLAHKYFERHVHKLDMSMQKKYEPKKEEKPEQTPQT